MQDSAAAGDLSDAQIAALQELLDSLPEGFQPLDLSAIDGYLCGVLLQPRTVAPARWWPAVVGALARRVPAPPAVARIRELVQRRHAALQAAIAQRRWFDPWLLEAGASGVSGASDAEAARQAVLPWVAGFALAQQQFPHLEEGDSADLIQALALLYQYLHPEDLEDDQGELAAAVAELEPAQTLEEAAEDLVRATFLLADVARR
jgi:uncharacterized protein